MKYRYLIIIFIELISLWTAESFLNKITPYFKISKFNNRLIRIKNKTFLNSILIYFVENTPNIYNAPLSFENTEIVINSYYKIDIN